MRPIKFRAWDKTRGRWIPQDMVAVTSDGKLLMGWAWKTIPGLPSELEDYSSAFVGADRGSINEFDGYEVDAELTLFTGLTDRNGKEIYEGDVVKITDHKFPEVNEPVYRKVVYIDFPPLCGFGLADFSTSTYNEPLGRIMKDIDDDWQVEVIGNIYENPELLK